MKYNKYIALSLMALSFFACKKYEPITFSDKPSFEFRDTLLSAPMGFITEGVFKTNLEIYLLGRIPESDVTLSLIYSGSAQNGRDFDMPTTFTFPKGATKVMLPVEIVHADDLEASGGRELIITIAASEANTPGVRPKSKILIEVGMPTQWVGYDNDHSYVFNNYFAKCTKARYQYLYDNFGFYDFKTLPEYTDKTLAGPFRIKLEAIRAAANQMIVEENAQRELEGKDPLKDDDGSDLVFKN